MRCNHCKRTLSVWACTSAIALLSGSAVFAELPRHPAVQTLEATPEEIQPIPDEMPQDLWFGQAVAIRDGTAFVAMPKAFDHGRVAIFTQTTSGWQRTGTLEPPAGVPTADFGRSLDFRDGYLIVGSTRSVFVYRRGGGQWNLSQHLDRPAGETASDYAQSLHFESNILVVGAPHANSTASGTVYVYERNAAGTLVFRTALKPTDSHANDWFGFDVSVAAHVIVIGAPNSNSTGGVYVFRRNSTGAWTQRQRLVANETQANDSFGWSVAIDKNMIVAGAPNVDIEGAVGFPETPDGHIAAGAAYGFVPVSGSFVETFKLRPRPDENSDFVGFGADIAMFNKRIVVSADHEDPNTTQRGYVHSYLRSGSTVTALGLAEGFMHSTSISLANQLLLVGSPFDFQCEGIVCIGEANVFDLSKFAQ